MFLHTDHQGLLPVSARTALDAEALVYEFHAMRYPDVHPTWVYVEPNEITGPQGQLRQTEAYDVLAARSIREKAEILFPRFKAIGKVVLSEGDGVDLAGDFQLLCAISTRLDPGFHELLELHRQLPGNEDETVPTMLGSTLPPAKVINGVLDEVKKAKHDSPTLRRYLASLSS